MTAADAGPVAAIVLAAGASTRLGQPKQLVLFQGERLLERAIRIAAAAGLQPVIVVLGASAATILERLDGAARQAAEFVQNDAWPEGMGSSIRVGMARLPVGVAGTVLLACDQPAVTPAHLQGLRNRDPAACTASAYAGRRGVPAYFPRSAFAQLERMQGEHGARSLLADAAVLELDGGDFDIDTPADLAAVQRLDSQRASRD